MTIHTEKTEVDRIAERNARLTVLNRVSIDAFAYKNPVDFIRDLNAILTWLQTGKGPGPLPGDDGPGGGPGEGQGEAPPEGPRPYASTM